MKIRPIELRAANAFTAAHHRHHPPVAGHRWSLGLYNGDQLVGVAIAGRPKARALQDGTTIEVTRVTTDGTRNACSMLLAAVARAAHALGYERIITYTLAEESGASLRAAGWKPTAIVAGASWSRPSRPRTDHHPTTPKLRWTAP